jgi:DNA-binding NarL/FixJ family response regulator
MPGLDSWRATAAIRRELPGSRILVFTTPIGDEHGFRAIQAGALATS